MARYYFHLRTDSNVLDEKGLEFPDLAAARLRAIETARAMACADILLGRVNLDHSIEVADDQGAALLSLTFREAFEIGRL